MMAKKRQACIVGYCGKTPIIDGPFVLYMIDTVGMPFDLVLQELKDRGWDLMLRVLLMQRWQVRIILKNG